MWVYFKKKKKKVQNPSWKCLDVHDYVVCLEKYWESWKDTVVYILCWLWANWSWGFIIVPFEQKHL